MDFPDSPISYRVVRSKRRTVAIVVRPDGQVEVRAPLRFPFDEIDRFIRRKADWIHGQQARMQDRRREREAGFPAPGNPLPLGGREYPAIEGTPFSFDGERFTLPPADWPAFREELIRFYRGKTGELLAAAVGPLAWKAGVVPSAVKVSGAVSRWGSCSGKNRLNFSFQLAAADPRAAEYVIVHELCHIREHNHSPAFWALVEELLPDYRERQALLRETERRLAGWWR